jgi:hydroxycarboxylate dehydrogenase B
MPTRRAEDLHSLGVAIFTALGATAENADGVMASLVGANLAGHDSHGVLRIPSYVEAIRAGQLRPAASPTVTHETPATAVVNGAATFGQLGARLAATIAAGKARDLGIGAASAFGCAHTGRIGEWAETGAREGFVTFAAASGAHGPYQTVPFGGRERALGTNPFAWAIPRAGGAPPILLDYATSAVARGKLLVARDAGKPVPEGWIIDRDGRPTTDVEDFFGGGALLPFAGHKGYAMSVIVEMLAVGLSNGQRTPPDGQDSCLFVACFAPSAFVGADDFARSIDRIAARLEEQQPAEGVEAVLLPGEPETISRRERGRVGIPLADATWAAITRVARELGVEHPALA